MSDSVKNGSDSSYTSYERSYYLDWLRIIAIFLVFIYHGTRFFDGENWHLKNDVIDSNLTVYMSFLTALGMPLFFIIAGMGTFFTLAIIENRKVKSREYISLRFIRLLIPFFIGLFTHIPLQVYLERVNTGEFSGSFFQFYPSYFDGIYEFGGNFSIVGHHLWFLVILFLFSLFTLNFFTFLRKEKNQKRILSFLKNPQVILFLPVPIFLSELTYSSLIDFPLFGGWNIFSLLLYYIFGFILSFDNQLMETIKKHIKKTIIINGLSIVLLAIIVYFFHNDIFQPTPNVYPFSEPLFWLFRTIFAWSGLIIILFTGYSYLNKDSKLRKSLNELVLPFYILHQTVLITLGFFIIQFNEGILIKYILIITSSFACIFILLLIIREENTLRFLFGMRPKQEKSIRRFFRRIKKIS
ncbi:acyltransferase family protein [Candidatus Hodarchaeum mangrovi]